MSAGQPLTGPRFLSKAEVVALHDSMLRQYGGLAGIRDESGLDGALAMPAQGFGGEFLHTFPFGMAAAYAFHIAKNHPFLDGNKRTAFSAMVTFLRINGWNFIATEAEAERVVLDVVTGEMSKEQLASWLPGRSVHRPTLELRDFFAALSYARIAEMLQSGLVDSDLERAHAARTVTILEASAAIPAIAEANAGAMALEAEGNEKGAAMLLGQSHLLTAIYRIAEDMGYEW